MNHRPLRVSNLIRDELSNLLLREVETPGALLTITEVIVDSKLDTAKVKVSVLPSEKAAMALSELKSKRGELQHLLNHKLNIKPMPRISFEIDHGPEKAAGIEKILLNQ